MKYLDEYRDPELARNLLDQIEAAVTRPWVMMEVCGGQTHSIIRNGIDKMLPPEVELVHGPGCPVCVTPLDTIDKALAIAAQPGVIFCSFGDMLRVPGSEKDLFRIKSEGGDIRVVYSPLDAFRIAQQNPDRQVVFFGIGFETTAPANACTDPLRVEAADAETEGRRERTPRPAGEDLDHAAQRLRAVQAGERSAHDLDALDLLDRDVLQRGAAAGRRPDPDAVHQHQHVVGLGAAQEQRRRLAGAAVVGQRHPGRAAQQVRQRVGLQAFDVVAVDHGDRGEGLVLGSGGARGGDDDLVEVGGRIERMRGGDHGKQHRRERGRADDSLVQGWGRRLHAALLGRACPRGFVGVGTGGKEMAWRGMRTHGPHDSAHRVSVVPVAGLRARERRSSDLPDQRLPMRVHSGFVLVPSLYQAHARLPLRWQLRNCLIVH